jgi:UDP-2,3-diacylglucosamine pyrophosphatase LpxH
VTFYDDKLARFRELLGAQGYEVHFANAAVSDGAAAPVTLEFPTAVLGENTLIAIPDIHISDGGDGDIFFDGDAANVARFTATLEVVSRFMDEQGDSTFLIQLGDWYDVWRAIGKDTDQSKFSKIENVAAYQKLYELDKELGLYHLNGNHDASFTHSLPDRRVSDSDRFAFGAGVLQSNGRIFALHGHQTDAIEGVPSPPSDQHVVWLATLAARYVTTQGRTLENFIDKEGVKLGTFTAWLGAMMGLNRPDPVPEPRARRAPPPGMAGSFVEREQVDLLVAIAVEACRLRYPQPTPLELLLVGHSHKPCLAWTPHPTTQKPVIVIDAGSWVYGAAQILFGAGNRITVFDIVRKRA